VYSFKETSHKIQRLLLIGKILLLNGRFPFFFKLDGFDILGEELWDRSGVDDFLGVGRRVELE
jgi:hypothetical protein